MSFVKKVLYFHHYTAENQGLLIIFLDFRWILTPIYQRKGERKIEYLGGQCLLNLPVLYLTILYVSCSHSDKSTCTLHDDWEQHSFTLLCLLCLNVKVHALYLVRLFALCKKLEWCKVCDTRDQLYEGVQVGCSIVDLVSTNASMYTWHDNAKSNIQGLRFFVYTS